MTRYNPVVLFLDSFVLILLIIVELSRCLIWYQFHLFTNTETDTGRNLSIYLKEPHKYNDIRSMNTRYSQVRQDITVYNFFQKKNGFFIKMGAYDGLLLSNTLWLERCHNWTGLLIEANPGLCKSIDNKKRRAWRLCACVSSRSNTTFIKGGALGSSQDTVDTDQMKQLNKHATVTVPCFKLQDVLGKLRQYRINYFRLDVEGAELFILDTMKSELKSRKIIIDVWTIEYRVWDGSRIIVDKSKNNLQNLRKFFGDVGGYTEHSQLSNTADTSDGMALDVVFINNKTWCKRYKKASEWLEMLTFS